LDKISPEIELSISDPSRKDRPAPVLIPHIPILFIQNNPLTHSTSPSLSCKSLSPSPTSGSQQPLQPVLQTPQESSELRRFKHQTQIPFREKIHGEQEHPTNILWNPLWQLRERFFNLIMVH